MLFANHLIQVCRKCLGFSFFNARCNTWNILHVALTVYLFDFKKDILYTRSSQDKSHDLSVSVRISTAAVLASTRRRHYKHRGFFSVKLLLT